MIERRFTIRVEAAHRTGIPDWNEENHRLISPKPGFSNPTPGWSQEIFWWWWLSTGSAAAGWTR